MKNLQELSAWVNDTVDHALETERIRQSYYTVRRI